MLVILYDMYILTHVPLIRPDLAWRRHAGDITPVIRVREPALASAPHLGLNFGKSHSRRFPPVAPLRTCSAATGKNCASDDPAF